MENFVSRFNTGVQEAIETALQKVEEMLGGQVYYNFSQYLINM
jgi:hypothetical protein